MPNENTTKAKPSGPLQGYRVLELCSTIAGPVCARLLADFGADVIKIEPPGGDPVRSMGFHKGDISLFAASILRNKKSMMLDIKTEEGRAIVLELAKSADIIVENFRPGTLERLGLGYEALSAQNPGLILVRISGYGQTGPSSGKPGYGAICEAFGGLRYLTGDPDRPPARCAVAITDYVTAVYAAFGALLAVIERQHSGRGQVVDAALYEAAFSMMEVIVPAFDQLGIVPTRQGSRMHGAAPNNIYATSDNSYLLIAANNDQTFVRLAKAMGREELLENPRFATIRARGENIDLVDAEVEAWLQQKTADEAMEILEAAAVPVSKVYTVKDIFEDPHYRARDMLVSVDSAALGPVTIPGIVPKLSRTPGSIYAAGHEVGQDTREILGQRLGMSEADLTRLERRQIIGGAKPRLSLGDGD